MSAAQASDLSPLSQNPQKRAECGGAHLEPKLCGGRDRRIPEAGWLAGQTESEGSRFSKTYLKNEVEARRGGTREAEAGTAL